MVGVCRPESVAKLDAFEGRITAKSATRQPARMTVTPEVTGRVPSLPSSQHSSLRSPAAAPIKARLQTIAAAPETLQATQILANASHSGKRCGTTVQSKGGLHGEG